MKRQDLEYLLLGACEQINYIITTKEFFENFNPKTLFPKLWKKLKKCSKNEEVQEVIDCLNFIKDQNLEIPKTFLKNKKIKVLNIKNFQQALEEKLTQDKYRQERFFYHFRVWVPYLEQREIVKSFISEKLENENSEINSLCQYMKIFEFSTKDLKEMMISFQHSIQNMNNREEIVQILINREKCCIDKCVLNVFQKFLNQYAIENCLRFFKNKKFSKKDLSDAIFLVISKKSVENCIETLLQNNKISVVKLVKICSLRDMPSDKFLKIKYERSIENG